MAPAPHSDDQHSLWLLTIAPTLWMLHLLVSYGTAAVWCGKFAAEAGPINHVPRLIAVYSVVALIGIALVGWRGWQRHRHVPAEDTTKPAPGDDSRAKRIFEGGGTEATTHDLDTPADRYRFVGFATVLLSGLSAVAVLYAALVARYFETCR